jgi:hypothetical protein
VAAFTATVSWVIVKYIFSLISYRKSKEKLNNIQLGRFYIYLPSKMAGRIKYAIVSNKEEKEGHFWIHYYTIIWDSFFHRYECDGPEYLLEVNEFYSRYCETEDSIEFFDYNNVKYRIYSNEH